MSIQADPGGIGAGLASDSAPPRFVLIFGLGQVVATIPWHLAD